MYDCASLSLLQITQIKQCNERLTFFHIRANSSVIEIFPLRVSVLLFKQPRIATKSDDL